MENTKTWIVVADASQARIFSTHKARLFQDPTINNLTLMGEYSHPESRKKISELVSDKMGEFGSGTFVENTSPKTHEAEQFALELAHQLESARTSDQIKEIVLIAPPAFMGLLNKHLTESVKRLISLKIEKDYTHNHGAELVRNLLSHF